MPKVAGQIDLVEASPDRYVLDTAAGRVIIEPGPIRFYRNGEGRGVSLLTVPRELTYR
jgi:hypothetical protein